MAGNHRPASDNGGCARGPKALEVEVCAKEAGDTVVVLHSNSCPSVAGSRLAGTLSHQSAAAKPISCWSEALLRTQEKQRSQQIGFNASGKVYPSLYSYLDAVER